MTFAWPWALAGLLLVPLLFALRWLLRRRHRRAAVTVTSIALVRAALPGRTGWRRRIPAALLVLGLLVLGIGAARPQATVPVGSNSTTILLALDISGSMCSTDVDPNRLTAAQAAASEFVESQVGGSRIGLVTFAGSAGLVVPPTNDTQQLLDALENLTTFRGTAIGQSILASIDAIAEIDPTVAPTGVTVATGDPDAGYAASAIVVLTDGANTRGIDPQTAAEQAAARHVRVFTIGFGTTEPAPMVCDGTQIDFGGFGNWGGGGWGGGWGGGGGGFDGGVNPLLIDEPALQQIADTTGGTYYRAENAAELASALSELPATFTTAEKTIDVSAWFAAVGALLVAAAVALSLWWSTPRRRTR